jgi:hypothetical protein
MMVPQNRLLWFFGSTILPATLAAAVYPALYMMLWLMVTCVLGLCVFGAVSITMRRHNVGSEHPEQVSLTRRRETHIALTVGPSSWSCGEHPACPRAP